MEFVAGVNVDVIPEERWIRHMQKAGVVEFIVRVKFRAVFLFFVMVMNYPGVSQGQELETKEIKSADKQERVEQDSTVAEPPSSGTIGLDSIKDFLKSRDWSSIIPPLSSMGTVTIPKGYVFIFIGMLAIGGLMIFIADSVQSRKRRKAALIQRDVLLQSGVPAQNGVSMQNGMSMQKGATDYVIKAFKMQSVFEAFVVTLFDPLYFRPRRPKAEHVFAAKVSEGETVPDLEFEFNHKETRMRFAIKCLYYKNRSSRELQLFSAERQQVFREFEEDQKMDLYYILGIGGTPDDPKELYLVPSKAIRSEFIRKEALRPYWKSGMFFYNKSARRLQ